MSSTPQQQLYHVTVFLRDNVRLVIENLNHDNVRLLEQGFLDARSGGKSVIHMPHQTQLPGIDRKLFSYDDVILITAKPAAKGSE